MKPLNIYQWDTASQSDKDRIMKRSQASMDGIREYVAGIIKEVRENGDAALVKYTQKFDNPNFTADKIRVSKAEIKKAYKTVGKKVIATMKEQIRISSTYAKADRKSLTTDWSIETVPGVVTGSRLTPIESVGLYVPAGKAPLPVVAQILAVPGESSRGASYRGLLPADRRVAGNYRFC